MERGRVATCMYSPHAHGRVDFETLVMALEGAWVAMHVWKMGMNKMDENGDGYDRWWVLQMVSWVKLDMVSMDDVESDGYEDEKKWSAVSVVTCMGLCLHENGRMTS